MSKRPTFSFAVDLRLAYAAALLLAVLVGAATTVTAQGAPAKPASSPGSEGIQVHGNWTIDVRQADGTLMERREFKNALTDDGKTGLLQLLAGFRAGGEWAVGLLGGSAGQLPPCGAPGSNVCFIRESASAPWASQLTLKYVDSFTGLELSGHITADRDGRIGIVSTRMHPCRFNIPETPVCRNPQSDAIATPVPPGSDFPFVFTLHELKGLTNSDKPIDVVQGQIVQIKVVISFS